MSRRSETSLALALLAIGAALLTAWLWRRDEPRSPAHGDAAAEDRAGGERATAPSTIEPPASDAASARTETTASNADARATRVELVGAIETSQGPGAGLELIVARATSSATPSPPDAGVRLEVRELLGGAGSSRSYVHGVVGRADSQGDYRVDVTALLAGRSPSESHAVLWVKVLRPGALPLEFEVWARRDERWRAKGETLEIRADLALRPSFELRGRVLLEGSVDQERGVALFAFADGAPVGPPLHNPPCDATGEFRLWAEADGAAVLVAHSEGFRPHARVLEARRGGEHIEIVLERGASISGRVTVAGATTRATVLARYLPSDPGARKCWLDEGRLTWSHGAVEWTAPSVECDSDGRFELRGLAPGAYELRLGQGRAAYVGESSPMEVVAPAANVELGAELARVELLVFRAGAPAPRTLMWIGESGPLGERATQQRSDDDGRLVLWLNPDCAVSVWSDARSADEHRIPIPHPGPGRTSSLRVDF